MDSPTDTLANFDAFPIEDGKYLNRDLSWLEFNQRVLALASDERTPLLERVNFLAIFASNLDEFFMKRVGLLRRRIAQGLTHSANRPGELPPTQTLAEIRSRVHALQQVQADAWSNSIQPALADAGIHILDYDQLDEHQQRAVNTWYHAEVFPILTPLAVDPGHRFPFISNLSVNLGVRLEHPEHPDPKPLFARVKIPSVLPQLVRVDALRFPDREPDDHAAVFIPLTEVIRHNLDELFPGLDILEVLPFRITRNAALEIDDEETEDLLEQVELELRMRRFADALRIQVNPRPAESILDLVCEELVLNPVDVYERPGPLAFTDLFRVYSLDRPDLKEKPWNPAVPKRLADPETDIFAVIRDRDVLVHHPYETFRYSVERFIAQAARDPQVLAIKQTLYRTSRDSPFIDSLIHAAEEGKQVACMVEVRARFDEEKNVQYARQLEAAGVHVSYGVVGLKTHCKCSLIVRRETVDGVTALQTYCHLGTGNYHPKTAQLYTDIGLLTADPEITQDVAKLFNALTGHTALNEYRQLLIAPATMRLALNELIDNEIDNARHGRPARIVAKMNAFEDRQLTDKLYEASNAGVKIDLVVRGFSCLRPGVPGMSENIRVVSIVGRFLEHSRLFVFADGHDNPGDGKVFIGSADWMNRSLNSRVEAVTPIRDPDARARIWNALTIMLRDHRDAWRLEPSGAYTRLVTPADADPASPEVRGTFRVLMDDATANAGPITP
ncbi:MAG: polyphosphate kinase [Phycisphaerales bacterium]|jgi:polyphosphate kinase